jgi:hypothetical protein
MGAHVKSQGACYGAGFRSRGLGLVSLWWGFGGGWVWQRGNGVVEREDCSAASHCVVLLPGCCGQDPLLLQMLGGL